MGIAIIFLLASAASLVIEIGCCASKPKPLPEALDLASMQLLQKVYESSADKNVVISPLGVFTLLSLYVFDVETHVADEIVDFLRAANRTQLTDSYRKLSRELSGMNPDVLGFFNNVFIDSQLTIDYTFFLNALSYKSEVNIIDFENPKFAANKINEWVSEKTKGKINRLVSVDDMKYDLYVALYNVISFKGHWGVPFDEHFTKDNCFITDDFELVKKPTMHIIQNLDYYEDNVDADAKMIQLPYKESKLKMVVILPNRIDGLSWLLRWVSEIGLLPYVNHLNNSKTDVYLDLPRFEIKSKYNLKNILPKVGIASIFDYPVDGIVNEGPVALEDILQEAFITVDEKGSTASGAKGLDIREDRWRSNPRSLPSPTSFLANHPFFYAVLYDDLVLLAGTYSH